MVWLMYGLPRQTVFQLQRVQNSAARHITPTRKFDHISPVLRQLHWLPVAQRVMFKTVTRTYRALHGLSPNYITDLLKPYVPARTLRSAGGTSLTVPPSRLRSNGDRRFAYAALTLSNSIPLNVRNTDSLNAIKRMLKTHLFSGAM